MVLVKDQARQMAGLQKINFINHREIFDDSEEALRKKSKI
jgi:hypothetical protein